MKMLSSRLQQCFGPLKGLISKECSETGVLQHSSNLIFRNESLRPYWSYESNLFFEIPKFYIDFGNSIKHGVNVHGVEDNCVWTCARIYCQLWQNYMWWGVNLLKTGPKISDPTKRHDTQLNLCHINRTLV